jgi:ABC-type transport system involved in multi-copper enzyme maturation permease subunit
MKKVLCVAFLNFKGVTRDKFFLNVLFFFIFYLFFCIFMGELSWGHREKVLRDAGLVGIELSTVILVIFSYTFTFYREKDSRSLDIYLTNFSRTAYISGKILGFFILTLFYLVLCGAVFSVLLCFYQSFHLALWAALYLLYLKILIVIVFASIFSSLLSSPYLALISSLALYLGSLLAPSAVKMTMASGRLIQEFIAELIYSLLPNMDKLDINSMAVYGKIPSLRYMAAVTIYALIYIIFLWLINIFVFRKKEY